MAGPWEKYAAPVDPAAPAADAGPWAKYAGPTREQRAADQQAADRKTYDPTAGNSFLQNTVEGIGRGMASVGRGVGQMVGLSSDEDVAEARRLDAPLMASSGGTLGNGIGNAAAAAPLALVPGANTLLGASLGGAAFGGLTTEGGLEDRFSGAGVGALGGAGGVLLGKGAGALADRLRGNALAKQTANAGKDAAAASARGAGYVLPPTEVNPNMLNTMLEGMSGKIKTSQSASAKNQPVTNDLAKRSLGLPADQPISPQALAKLRADAGLAYEAVGSTGTMTPGQSYTDALDAIAKPYVQAAQAFPKGKANPIIAEIEALKSPQFDAASAVAKIKTLRADADVAYGAGNKDLGKALKAGAGALEDAIDGHLTASGAAPDLLKNFREARQLIAKSYSVEKALNPTTGDVSAKVLAGQLKRGRPLSNELRTIAEAGQAFPKATQALEQNYNAMSPLDYMAGLMGSTATGNPLMAAGMAARPGVRAAILSQPYQRMLSAPSYGGDNVLLNLLRDNRLLPTAGVVTSKK